MSLNSMLLWPVYLIAMAMIIGECGAILFSRVPTPRPRVKRPKTCKFDNRRLAVGYTWHPHLEPNGINYCITCKCQKNGMVKCVRVKCRKIKCLQQIVPQGKCCPVCKGSLKRNPFLNQCSYNGKVYGPGRVWNVPMKNQAGRQNACAECTCHNGHVSCAVRLCPALTCSKILYEKEKDSCCMKCGLPIRPAKVQAPQKTKDLPGSCLSKGRYYRDKDLWNPVTETKDIKLFRQPNCNLCSCNNANVTCSVRWCPKLKCKNPTRRNSRDCCLSCPEKSLSTITPVTISRPLLVPHSGQSRNKGSKNLQCNFLGTIYQHNSSWSLQTPYCVRCTCMMSKVKCKSGVCSNSGGCKTNCSTPGSKQLTKRRTEINDCSGERVQVYLLSHEGSRKKKSRPTNRLQYFVKIALLYSKVTTVKLHHWNVNNNKVVMRSSNLRTVRFARRKASYTRLGETKLGRINRFLKKAKILAHCKRNCRNKAKDMVNVLKNRVKFLRKSCNPLDTLKSLLRSSL